MYTSNLLTQTDLMITVHIYSDRLNRYAFTNDVRGQNLPTEGFGVWQFLTTKTYRIDDKEFLLLPITGEDVNERLAHKGYFILDYSDARTRLNAEFNDYSMKFDEYVRLKNMRAEERNEEEFNIAQTNWQTSWNTYWHALGDLAKSRN